ncbi:hypothetical protein DOTSEDRAFT_132735 [Dothistroma septosporum NZE10]|uniref:Zn(2)-C6 fungal-type domain-containing protein n=1 Tax=Dothistroma septosporum (strain NZE10 / CBS 128990) TaxID=675120 RepID=M2YMG8_DOTSN|nr:hypothetical protein DOTSEDRAFT_132735 [Dothistroma septosporum NZE10]
MRPGKGCASCRERHLKCHTKTGSAKCTRCLEADRECTFAPKYRFRPVAHVDGSTPGDSRLQLRHSKDQPWVSTRKRCLRGAPISGLLLSPSTPPEARLNYGAASIEHMLIHDVHDADNSRAPRRAPRGSSVRSSATPPPEARTIRTLPDHSCPASIDELTRRHEDHLDAATPDFLALVPTGSKDGASTTSLPTPGLVPNLNLSRREGDLLQHFINKVGPWFDVCDLSNSFQYELPRRAMHRPMVLYAILALTSRHLAVLSSNPEPAEASYYHGQCLRLVIDQLSGPESLYDDNLLSTVVCLRVYEEIEHANDEQHHLHGTGRLLRAIPQIAHSGGLGEAACWQALRQDIYISLTRSVAPSFQLELFDQSSAFTFRDDGSCANIVVLLFAKILRLAYSTEEQSNSRGWALLKLDVEAWNARRCRLFQPIYYEDFDVAEKRPTPIIHMISPPQVAAMQYYHACRLVLLMNAPEPEQLTGFSAAKRRRTLERDVTVHLVAIVGLAESNPFVENANLTATHLLRVAGYCITNSLQRGHVLQFLKQVEKVMGWSTAPTVATLKEQWNDLDGPND